MSIKDVRERLEKVRDDGLRVRALAMSVADRAAHDQAVLARKLDRLTRRHSAQGQP